MGKQWKQWQISFGGGSKITADDGCSHEIKRHLLLGRKSMNNLKSILKIRDITLPTKVCLVKAMVFPVVVYECESWTIKKVECQKNWCFWNVVLVHTLESPLDWKEINPVNPKGNWSWVLMGRTDAEFETPIFWPPDAKNWLIGKDHDAGKDWRQEEKGALEDEMFGLCHQLNGHDFGHALGIGDGQGILVCCSPWRSQSQTQLWLNWTETRPWTRHWNFLALHCISVGWDAYSPCLYTGEQWSVSLKNKKEIYGNGRLPRTVLSTL